MSQKWLSAIAVIGMMGCTSLFPPTAKPVSFQSIPAGATVRLNGEVAGVTPFAATLDCSQGSPEVAFELLGYDPYTQRVPTQDVLDGRGTISWPVKQCASVVSVPLRPTPR